MSQRHLDIYHDWELWADKYDARTNTFLDPDMDPEARANTDRKAGGDATPWDFAVPKGWYPTDPEWLRHAPGWWITEQLEESQPRREKEDFDRFDDPMSILDFPDIPVQGQRVTGCSPALARARDAPEAVFEAPAYKM